ncbi:hypothetical protein J1N35_016223 [Gossypium stocksii]|uniref:Uncharacterized protein n=1 Tax=Gossypium stocksii TaxID=47602 RepID=A0A9D3VJS0_9ROSI|nr:hypothetical protein J1N35_016223 [Gossypium stocksii]
MRRDVKGKKRNRGWTRGNVVPNPSQGDTDTRASIIPAQHNRVGRSVEKRQCKRPKYKRFLFLVHTLEDESNNCPDPTNGDGEIAKLWIPPLPVLGDGAYATWF